MYNWCIFESRKEKEIYFLIKIEKNPNYNIPYTIFEESMELIKSIKQKHQKEMPTVIPIIMYIGNQKWNIKQKNKNQDYSFSFDFYFKYY